jgi:hypothetical protein
MVRVSTVRNARVEMRVLRVGCGRVSDECCYFGGTVSVGKSIHGAQSVRRWKW